MLHDLLESQVIFLEFFALLLQLLLDVLVSNENSLKVHPLLLNLQPHLDTLRDQVQTPLPVTNPGIEGTSILARSNCLQISQLILKKQLLFISISENPAAIFSALLVFGKIEVLLLPHLLNLVQLLLVLELLHGLIDDLQHLLLVPLQLKGENLVQSHSLHRCLPFTASQFHQFLPVTVSNRWIFQLFDERNGIFECNYLIIELRKHTIAETARRVVVAELSLHSHKQLVE